MLSPSTIRRENLKVKRKYHICYSTIFLYMIKSCMKAFFYFVLFKSVAVCVYTCNITSSMFSCSTVITVCVLSVQCVEC